VAADCIVSVHNVSEIYKVPLLLKSQNVAEIISSRLKMYLPKGMPSILPWEQLCRRIDNLKERVRIVLVGKYTAGTDAYLSVQKALQHAAIAVNRQLEIEWVLSEHLEDTAAQADKNKALKALNDCNGILVPGGFGERGVEGMVRTCQFAREKKKPFLGICLGMQVAVIEVARNILGWKVPPLPHPRLPLLLTSHTSRPAT
jgi:CTP synthase